MMASALPITSNCLAEPCGEIDQFERGWNTTGSAVTGPSASRHAASLPPAAPTSNVTNRSSISAVVITPTSHLPAPAPRRNLAVLTQENASCSISPIFPS